MAYGGRVAKLVEVSPQAEHRDVTVHELTGEGQNPAGARSDANAAPNGGWHCQCRRYGSEPMRRSSAGSVLR